jgi:hypothetical protein
MLHLTLIRFKKLASDNENKARVVNAYGLLMFASGGEDRKALDLPARLDRHVPAKINAICKKIVLTIKSWPSADKELEWLEFAAIFGLSERDADEGEQASAAVRIQAMSRRKSGAQVALDRRRKKLDGAEAGAYTQHI